MIRIKLVMLLAAAASISSAMTGGSADAKVAASSRDIVTTLLARRHQTTSGNAMTMPTGHVDVIATRYDIPPGASLPPHLHVSPRYAFVQSGTLAVTNMEDGRTHVFRAGDFIAEDVYVVHRARNLGKDRVRLLVIDVVPKRVSNVVLASSSTGRTIARRREVSELRGPARSSPVGIPILAPP